MSLLFWLKRTGKPIFFLGGGEVAEVGVWVCGFGHFFRWLKGSTHWTESVIHMLFSFTFDIFNPKLCEDVTHFMIASFLGLQTIGCTVHHSNRSWAISQRSCSSCDHPSSKCWPHTGQTVACPCKKNDHTKLPVSWSLGAYFWNPSWVKN